MKVLCAHWLVLSHICWVYAFKIHIDNFNPLLRGLSNAEIDVDIYFMPSEQYLIEGRLCMSVNATICHCYKDSIHELRVTLPSSCISAPPYYLAFVIYTDEVSAVSAPLYVADSPPLRDITLVLPLTLEDIARCYLLLLSLQHVDTSLVAELIIISPDPHQPAIEALLTSQAMPFPIRYVSESSLFHDYASLVTYPYAIQMALKLLVSQIVSTHYYLTLDADVLFLHNLTSLIHNTQATYQHEDRSVHPTWWESSQRLLQLPPSDVLEGISVTPVLLHTYGAVLTLHHLKELYGETYQLLWLNSFGHVLWSEYTMYRLVLDYYKIWNELHVRSEEFLLHCRDVWYAADLPWNVQAAMRSNCLTSVVQSSSGASVNDIYRQLYYYYDHLRMVESDSAIGEHFGTL